MGEDKDDDKEDSSKNSAFSFAMLKNSIDKVGVFMINLTLVYVFEYICTASFANRAHLYDKDDENIVVKNAYPIQSFTYQQGVFVSRTSVQWFQFKKVTILTVFQFFNLIMWTFIAVYYDFFSIWFQIPLMLWTGLMGGCSYSNSMYFVLNCEDLDKNEKEVTINIGSIFYDAGIFFATAIAQIISNFVLKYHAPQDINSLYSTGTIFLNSYHLIK